MDTGKTFTAFVGTNMVAAGSLQDTVAVLKGRVDAGETLRMAIYDDVTCRTVDVDYSGSTDEVLARLQHHPLLAVAEAELEPEKRTGPGRPKIGVVSREVSLLPRHWDWLNEQPNGASGTLRQLVEEARKKNLGRDKARAARDALHRFLWDMAGDLPQFEEATRAYFAKDFEHFRYLTSDWPGDICRFIAPRLNHLESQKDLL